MVSGYERDSFPNLLLRGATAGEDSPEGKEPEGSSRDLLSVGEQLGRHVNTYEVVGPQGPQGDSPQ